MSMTPYTGLGFDPFFGQMERALDRAFDRALGSRSGGDIAMFMPTLTGPSTAGGHPMVSIWLYLRCLCGFA